MARRYKYVTGTVGRYDINGATMTVDIVTASGTVTLWTNSVKNQKMLLNWYGDMPGWVGSYWRVQVAEDNDEILGVG